jgi:hypothetical protein
VRAVQRWRTKLRGRVNARNDMGGSSFPSSSPASPYESASMTRNECLTPKNEPCEVTEERYPRPLRRVILLMPSPSQRPCDGDVSFYREPSFGIHAFGALARVIARVEWDVDPIAPREERVGCVEGKRDRRG